MMKPGVRIYGPADFVPTGERFVAFLLQEVEVRDAKRQKTGETRKIMLPVRFMGETAEAARNAAMTFWDDETAKERAKKERGAALGKSRKAAA